MTHRTLWFQLEGTATKDAGRATPRRTMPIFNQWNLQPAPDDPPLAVSSKQIRAILVRRGVRTDDELKRFVAPTLDDLHDPSTIHGMGEACERIERAIANRETVLIYGDYDVDGVTSIVLLKTVLASLGAVVDFVVPHRLVDGYGLKTEVLDRVLAERNVRLVITVDCGITSVDPVRRAIERGIDVIITDHHLPPGALPSAAAVLNPKQTGCEYPYKDLAGVGVAFKLCCELLRRAGKTMSIESLVKVAAIGTVADVAPLTGENRVIARIGLAGLADPRNPGLRALIRGLGLLGKPLRATDVGFKIGPRINAAGRLASADTAIRLFAARSEEEAHPLVQELNRLNEERQAIGEKTTAEAIAIVEKSGALPRILVLASRSWHKGVLGLCAARVAQKYHRPTLMMRIENGICVGSGRSIASIDIHARLETAADLFTHFGGHSYACGFTVAESRLGDLRERLTIAFADLDDSVFEKSVDVDGQITLSEVSAAFADEHDALEPFGAGNPQPLFAIGGLECGSTREFSPGCHELVLRDATGSGRAVLWRSVSELLPVVSSPFDALVHVERDRYSPTGLRLNIIDAAAVGERLTAS